MPLEVIRGEEQAPLTPLMGRRVAVLGYGNQGRAHAMNLRDRQVSVVIGARPGGAGARQAAADGFDVADLSQAAAGADLVIIALPDEIHGEVWRTVIEPAVAPGQTIGFIHGYSVHFGMVSPGSGIGVVMVAPKGPGATLRRRFERGEGIPALVAVHQDSQRGDAEPIALAWASGIGSARAAILRTTFAAETESDLFGEQAVLCGGMLGLMQAAFDVLIDAGYPPEIAYIECCHELKQVADLLYERGPAGMAKAISNTAEFGAHEAAGNVVDESTRERLREILAGIQRGEFARRMQADHDAGSPWLRAQRQMLAESSIEQASATVRSYMPFLQAPDA